MEQLWFVLAAVCVVAGLALLWFDRRRRQRPSPSDVGDDPVGDDPVGDDPVGEGPVDEGPVDEGPGDLFRESHPR